MKIYHGKNNRNGIRDYSRRRYGNPLFRSNSKSRKSNDYVRLIRGWSVGILLLAAVVYGVWYFIWGPAFRVTQIIIEGSKPDTTAVIQQVLSERLSNSRLMLFPQSNIFLYDSREAEDDIRQLFFLDRLDIRKKLPNTVTVNISEKNAVTFLMTGGKFWALDEQGYVIRKLTRREMISLIDLPEGMEAVDSGELGSESVQVAEIENVQIEDSSPEMRRNNSNPMPLIIDRENTLREYVPGADAVAEEIIALVRQAYQRLPSDTGTGIRWFVLEATADTVDVVQREGWNIYMTTMIQYDRQVERLLLVLRDKIGDRRSLLEYVDLRYDERIFYRFREGEIQ
jgi:hypothetical protein